MDKTVVRLMNADNWYIVRADNDRQWVEFNNEFANPKGKYYLAGYLYYRGRRPSKYIQYSSNYIQKFLGTHILTEDACYLLGEPNKDYTDWIAAVQNGAKLLQPSRLTGSEETGYILDGTEIEYYPEGSVTKFISGKITRQEGNYIWFNDGNKFFVQWLYLKPDLMANLKLNAGYLDLFYPSDFDEIADQCCRPRLSGRLKNGAQGVGPNTKT